VAAVTSARLSRLVWVQRPGGTRDAVGGRLTTWTTVAEAWAGIEPLTGREAFLAAQRQAASSHLVTLRFARALAGIDASWRVVWGQRCVADAAADTLTVSGPVSYEVGDPVELANYGGALPAPLAANTTYFVKTAAAVVYTLAATAGGVTIDLTTTGTGRHLFAPRILVLDEPPRNLGERDRMLQLVCSEGVREE
jgi:head-tail adaptor